MKAYITAALLIVIGTTAGAQTKYIETTKNKTYRDTAVQVAMNEPGAWTGLVENKAATGATIITPAEEAIRLYPTQCINTLMVDNNKTGLFSYRIVTFDGREVSNGSLRPQGTTRINVGGYPSGSYFLFVTGDREAASYRFMKM